MLNYNITKEKVTARYTIPLNGAHYMYFDNNTNRYRRINLERMRPSQYLYGALLYGVNKQNVR